MGTRYYFEPDYGEQLIATFNATGDIAVLNELLKYAEPLIDSILTYRGTYRYEATDELTQKIRLKIWKSLRLYDSAKGTAFSFISKIIASTTASAIAETWTRNDRFVEINETVAGSMPANLASDETLQDIVHKVRKLKTVCTDKAELRAQRWFVESFLSSGFSLRRHEAANCAMKVFDLSHARSRQLYDLTLLEIRRQLINERRLDPVQPADLRGTKIAALIRYANYLCAEDFSRLATLMVNLAPALVLLVKPENICPIRRGEMRAILENLRLILFGHPNARNLFRGIYV
jgi:hypothetical protein